MMERTLLFTDYQPTKTTKMFVETVMDGVNFTTAIDSSTQHKVWLNKEDLRRLAHLIIDTLG